MARASNHTKKTRRKLWALRITHITLLVVPLLVYVGMALASGALVYQKIALVGTVMMALILTLFNFIAKRNLRAPIWIVILGLYFAMKEYLMPLIIILAIVSVLDDFLISPAIKHFKMKLVAHKTMDERGV